MLRILFSLLIAVTLVGLTLVNVPTAHAVDNPIVIENRSPGTDHWLLWRDPAISAGADDISKQIKGYASATSVNQGGSIDFYVTVNPAPQTFDIEIYRIGYYGGLGGRLMQTITGLPGTSQSACPPDATTGLIECHWNRSYTLTVPTSWTSGIYLATLINQNRYANYIIFVVRDDARTAALLYQMSVTTYQAYNGYPNDNQTGKSLYPGSSYGANTISGTKRAVKVSFDRPYMDSGAGQFLNWERYFVKWVERMGYDVTYSTDLDTHSNGAKLRNYKGFLSVGHDEYWSKQMYDAAEAARDAGVNLGFFGANDVYWQVRFENSSSGIPNRIMVCYKDASIDPVQGSTTTIKWRDPPINRPEQQLVGMEWGDVIQGGSTPSAYASFIVKNSTNWVYSGTGVTDGTAIPGIVGYEVDKYHPGVPLPLYINNSYTLVGESPYTTSSGKSDIANASIYQASSGAWVFAAGTIAWSWGLENFDVARADPRIQQMTANILNTFVGSTSPTPTKAPATPVVSSPTPTVVSSTPTGTSATLIAVADSYISSANPTSTAGGTSTTLRVDASPVQTTFLKFDLTPLAGKTISTVKLKFKTTSSTAAGSANSANVKFVNGVQWKEQYLSYNNPVPISATVLGIVPANSTPDTWYAVTLTPSAIQQNVGGLLSVAIEATGSDELILYSREATDKPQLVVTYK